MMLKQRKLLNEIDKIHIIFDQNSYMVSYIKDFELAEQKISPIDSEAKITFSTCNSLLELHEHFQNREKAILYIFTHDKEGKRIILPFEKDMYISSLYVASESDCVDNTIVSFRTFTI